MTIRIRTNAANAQTTITFTLTEDAHYGSVSVVGSFNDWNPHANPLLSDDGGDRSTSITLDTSEDVHFRYLGSEGVWYDDPDADEITSEGSIIRASHSGDETHEDSVPKPQDNPAQSSPTARTTGEGNKPTT